MYLSKIYIKNFRGIKELLVKFDKKLNVIIGSNGQLKTSLVDAIRLFYSWGEPNRDIEITKEDFHVEFTQNPDGTTTATTSTRIDICYLFEGLSAQQEGAFYQYLDKKDDGSMVARVHLSFEMKEKGRIYSSYITGKEENGIRADWNTFHYFHPYYLGALRDSTRDLMSTRNNLLGRVIKRKINRAGSEDDVKSIVDNANVQLLQRQEVMETQTGINDNLTQINRSDLKDVELHIEQNRIEYIVNIMCPFISVHRLNPHGHSIFLPERLRVSSCPHLGHALATGVDEDSDLTKVILKSSLHVNALSNVFFFPFNPFITSVFPLVKSCSSSSSVRACWNGSFHTFQPHPSATLAMKPPSILTVPCE